MKLALGILLLGIAELVDYLMGNGNPRLYDKTSS